MKKNLLMTGLVLFTLGATAQTTLTSLSFYQAGDELEVHEIDATNFNPGGSGANQTWDFSNLSTLSTGNMTIDHAANATNHSLFSPANLYGPDINNDVEAFYRVSPQSFDYVGLYGNQQGISFEDNYSTDPREILVAPFSYGDTYNGTFEGVFSAAGQGFDRGGTISMEADGYGTLILPYGTFTDVLRIRVVQDYADYFGTMVLQEYQDVYYHYVSTSNRGPLLSVVETEIVGSGFPKTSSGSYSVIDANGTEEFIANESKLTVFPSPVSDIINIAMEGHGSTAFEIVSITGQVVQSLDHYHANGLEARAYNVSDLPAGMYILRATSNEGVITQKFQKL